MKAKYSSPKILVEELDRQDVLTDSITAIVAKKKENAYKKSTSISRVVPTMPPDPDNWIWQ